MTQDRKNQGAVRSCIELPLPPAATAETEMDIYARFMRHLRMVPSSRMEIKVLSAIQFTADMMDLSDALVTKTLADMGLRAPRRALPASYLDHVDSSLMRTGFEVGAPSASAMAMKKYWDDIGEDRFAAFRKDYKLKTPEAMFVSS
jgi:hypothetical protein